MTPIARLAVAAMLSLGAYGLRRLARSTPAQPRDRGPVPHREPLQTWEGEGGALPTTGPQTGPNPA